jgi:predicted NAD/FAD-binding protein
LGPGFTRHYILPIGSAIWSAGLDDMLEFPAAPFIGFFKNHGLLSLAGRPRWQTVVGGSHSYLKAFRGRFEGELLPAAPVESLRRKKEGGVEVSARGRAPRVFERAVVAAHADEALRLLADPSARERALLGAWRYSSNRALLHTDASLLPENRRAWASWNYRRERGARSRRGVTVTYDMTRLQGLCARKRYFVTLNPGREPAPGAVIRELGYAHPVYDFAALAAQPGLASLNGARSTWYCGSYFGHGFHEDAVRSALAVARDFASKPTEVLL